MNPDRQFIGPPNVPSLDLGSRDPGQPSKAEMQRAMALQLAIGMASDPVIGMDVDPAEPATAIVAAAKAFTKFLDRG